MFDPGPAPTNVGGAVGGAGAGNALLVEALRALNQAAEPSLGLAVTHADAGARALYERLGFEYVLEGRVVALPAPSNSDPGARRAIDPPARTQFNGSVRIGE
jgi:ribosomal protein S18 acetylase RimI-like enzyme